MVTVTYSFTNNGNASSSEHDTIAAAMDEACNDARAKAADAGYAKTPISVDDHEGNFYDAFAINLQANGPGGH